MNDWFKARNIWGAAIMTLSDAEAGRLAKALWTYTMTGEQLNLSGAEKGIFAMILMTLGQDEQDAADISRKRAVAGSTGGKQTQANRSKLKQTEANEAIACNKNKEKDKEVVVVVDNAREGWLTDEEVHAALNRDSQIEDAARSVGLQVTEAGMIRGRKLADQYGLDKLLEAIPIAVDKPTWAYVEGILRNGGTRNGNVNRPDHSADHGGTQPGKYDYLFGT